MDKFISFDTGLIVKILLKELACSRILLYPYFSMPIFWCPTKQVYISSHLPLILIIPSLHEYPLCEEILSIPQHFCLIEYHCTFSWSTLHREHLARFNAYIHVCAWLTVWHIWWSHKQVQTQNFVWRSQLPYATPCQNRAGKRPGWRRRAGAGADTEIVLRVHRSWPLAFPTLQNFNLVTALAMMHDLYVWPLIYVAQQTSEMGGARRRLLCAQLNPCMQVLRSLEAQVKCTYRCS